MLLLTNGMFVTTEFAMTRLRQFDREELDGGGSLDLAWKMTEELEIYLTACQVGITITSILLGVVFEPGVTELIFPLTEVFGFSEPNTRFVSAALAVVLIQLMHTVWGEQSPTYLGVEKPLEVASVFAPVLYVWTWVSYPLIYVGDHLAKGTLGLFGISLTRSWTEDEDIEDMGDLRRQLGELLSKGELPEDRREEVINALEIEETIVEEIMIDRSQIKAINTERSVEENLELMSEERLSRFPLIDGSLDQYRGTIYVPGLIPRLTKLQEGEIQWEDVAVEMMTVSHDLPVSDLIDRFQEEQQELSLVLKANRVVGLVTSTDAFEEILGELRDPYD
ncbi:MAG: CNNM domain-containing protein [bacterium]